jgi:hypothetical protein
VFEKNEKAAGAKIMAVVSGLIRRLNNLTNQISRVQFLRWETSRSHWFVVHQHSAEKRTVHSFLLEGEVVFVAYQSPDFISE